MATQMVRGKGEEISSFDRMCGVLQKVEMAIGAGLSGRVGPIPAKGIIGSDRAGLIKTGLLFCWPSPTLYRASGLAGQPTLCENIFLKIF